MQKLLPDGPEPWVPLLLSFLGSVKTQQLTLRNEKSPWDSGHAVPVAHRTHIPVQGIQPPHPAHNPNNSHPEMCSRRTQSQHSWPSNFAGTQSTFFQGQTRLGVWVGHMPHPHLGPWTTSNLLQSLVQRGAQTLPSPSIRMTTLFSVTDFLGEDSPQEEDPLQEAAANL